MTFVQDNDSISEACISLYTPSQGSNRSENLDDPCHTVEEIQNAYASPSAERSHGPEGRGSNDN